MSGDTANILDSTHLTFQQMRNISRVTVKGETYPVFFVDSFKVKALVTFVMKCELLYAIVITRINNGN